MTIETNVPFLPKNIPTFNINEAVRAIGGLKIVVVGWVNRCSDAFKGTEPANVLRLRTALFNSVAEAKNYGELAKAQMAASTRETTLESATSTVRSLIYNAALVAAVNAVAPDTVDTKASLHAQSEQAKKFVDAMVAAGEKPAGHKAKAVKKAKAKKAAAKKAPKAGTKVINLLPSDLQGRAATAAKATKGATVESLQKLLLEVLETKVS